MKPFMFSLPFHFQQARDPGEARFRSQNSMLGWWTTQRQQVLGKMWSWCWAWVVSVCLCLGATRVRGIDPVIESFPRGELRNLTLRVSDVDLDLLRKHRRQRVEAELWEGTEHVWRVWVHLKGTQGSVQSVDEKPSWTLERMESGTNRADLFHGMKKWHFDNSAEDPTYLNAWLGSWFFESAGIPCPRVGHALVALNGRSLGWYVLQESFDELFLARCFQEGSGGLYEPGPGHDVNERLDRKNGRRAPSEPSLAALAHAAFEPALDQRWERLGEVLDRDRFLSFMAMEILTGHRDGYSMARNNFRIYADPLTHRFVFLPQGMDQLFGNPTLTWRPDMAGLVSRAILETDPGRELYRTRLKQLLERTFSPGTLDQRILAKVQQLISGIPSQDRASYQKEVDALRERIFARRRFLETDLSAPEPTLLDFSKGEVGLDGWASVDVPPESLAEIRHSTSRPSDLYLEARGAASMSFRVRKRLAPGEYRFQGRVTTRHVEPLSFGKRRGVLLRIGQTPSASLRVVTGTQDAVPLEVTFSVLHHPAEVEFICELVAQAGSASFDLGSLRVVRLK